MERYNSQQNNTLNVANISAKNTTTNVDIKKMPNPVLQRLLDEVRFETSNNISAYNRTHNRHNRGR